MLVPFAAAGIAGANGRTDVAATAMSAVVIYLLIYAAMNLGAFAVVIAVARRTRSGEISSYAGLFATSPGLAVTMTHVPGVAGRHSAVRRLVRQVRHVPDDHRGRHRSGIVLGVIAARQLGDRVLLLLRRRAPDVVRRARRGRPHPDPGAARARRRDRADGRGRADRRRVPASCSPGSGIGRSDRRPARSSERDHRRSRAIAHVIRREGPIPFDVFVEHALYDPDDGFFTPAAAPGRAGRDFVTSPEVGPLFGACVARALDRWWHELGEPDPFLVVEAGAGRAASPATCCAPSPRAHRALRYVLVERSAALRDAQHELLRARTRRRGARARSCGRPPDDAPVAGRRIGARCSCRSRSSRRSSSRASCSPTSCSTTCRSAIVEATVRPGRRCGSRSGGDEFCRGVVPAPAADAAPRSATIAGDLPVVPGARPPDPARHRRVVRGDRSPAAPRRGRGRRLRRRRAEAWSGAAAADGCAPTGRTSGAAHRSTRPAQQDITADVVREQLGHAPRRGRVRRRGRSPGRVARGLGIEGLVAEGRRAWEERAHIGDLEALAGRSRVTRPPPSSTPPASARHRVVTLAR